MTYREVQGDLLQMPPNYVVAHNIDAGEVALGAGVALALCQKFPNLRAYCKEYAENNEHKVGLTYRYTNGIHVVYNMYTKPHVYFNAIRGMTPQEYLTNQKNCLMDLRNQMLYHNETQLAIPRIACGLDRCQWHDIEQLLHEVFDETDIEIVVCYL